MKNSSACGELPGLLRPFFWDVDFQTISIDGSSYFIISRLMVEGAIKSKGLDTFVLNQTHDHTELIIRSVRVDLIRERIPLFSSEAYR